MHAEYECAWPDTDETNIIDPMSWREQLDHFPIAQEDLLVVPLTGWYGAMGAASSGTMTLASKSIKKY